MSFASDIRKHSREIVAEAEDDRKAIILKLFNAVIQATPVDTGRARGNWQASTGTPIESQIQREDKFELEQPGGQAQAQSEQVVLNSVFGETLHLSNNLPYILRLEYGSSSQNASGMVRQNLARIDQIVREVLNK